MSDRPEPKTSGNWLAPGHRSRYEVNHECTCGAEFKTLGGLRRHQEPHPGRALKPGYEARGVVAMGASKCEYSSRAARLGAL